MVVNRKEHKSKSPDGSLVFRNSQTSAPSSRTDKETINRGSTRHNLFQKMPSAFALCEMIYNENGIPFDYRYIEVNQPFGQLIGLNAKDILGKTARQVNPDVSEAWFTLVGNVATTGKQAHFSDYYSKPLNRYYEVFIYCPEPGQFATIVADKTENKLAEDKIKKTQDELKKTNELLKWELDVRNRAEEVLQQKTHDLGERVKELNCIYGIASLAQKANLSLDQILKGVVDLIPPGWQHPEITCARIIFDGQEFSTDNCQQTEWKQSSPIVTENEQVGILEVFYTKEMPREYEGPFLKEGRMLIDGISKQLGEIISRKQAEILLKERTVELETVNELLKLELAERVGAESGLAKREKQYRELVETLHEGIWMIDKDSCTTFANPRLAEMLGYTVEEMLGKHLFSFMDEKGKEIAVRNLEHRKIGIKERHDFEFIRKDGIRIYASLETSPIFDDDGTYTGSLAGVQDITSRRQMEVDLRYERNKLTAILDGMADGIYIVSQDYDIEYVNPVIVSQFGSVDGKKCYQYLHDQEEVCSWCKIEEVLAGNVVRWEWYSEKNRRTYDLLDTPLMNPDGSISKLEVFRDITERKEIESKLQRSEALFRALTEQSLDITAIINPDGTVRYLSPSIERITGFTTEDFNENVTDYIHPDDLSDLMNSYMSTLNIPDVIVTNEFRIRHIDGSWRNVECVGKNLIADPSINGIVVNARDVTKRKTAEMALQKAHDELELRVLERTSELEELNETLSDEVLEHKKVQDALQQSESRLRLMLEQVPSGFWITDTNLRVTSAMGKWLTASTSQLIGMTIEEYINTNTGDESAINHHRRALDGIPATYDLFMDGKAFHCHIEPLRDSNGRIIGVIGVSLDITERKQAEDALHALSKRLVETQEAERRAVGLELHDQIGQYLTALKLLLERTMQSTPDKQTVENLDEAQKLVHEVMTQVRNLSLDLRPRMLDDLGLLPALLWHFDRYTSQTNVQVNFTHSGLEQNFPQDTSTATYRILQEALTNTARHAGVNNVNVHIWADKKSLTIKVEDRGKGYDTASLPFGSTSGLNGMRERVLLLDGKFNIKSAPNSGTRLTAELPLPQASKTGKSKGKHA